MYTAGEVHTSTVSRNHRFIALPRACLQWLYGTFVRRRYVPGTRLTIPIYVNTILLTDRFVSLTELCAPGPSHSGPGIAQTRPIAKRKLIK